MPHYNFCSSSQTDFTLGYFTSCVHQEPEWDESSAFVAHAASHIRPKGSSRRSKENKENEARREVGGRAVVMCDECISTETRTLDCFSVRGSACQTPHLYADALCLFSIEIAESLHSYATVAHDSCRVFTDKWDRMEKKCLSDRYVRRTICGDGRSPVSLG